MANLTNAALVIRTYGILVSKIDVKDKIEVRWPLRSIHRSYFTNI